MRTCAECKQTKFWFQFFTSFEGLYTALYDVCKKCANKMRERAVWEYQCKLNAKND